jgi:heterodisulfide reductase subunit A
VEKEYPPEQEVSEEDPRIGVFVCHCGSNIAGYLDVEEVADHANKLPCVVHAETNLYACSQDSIGHITEQVEEHDLNRVVVASCTPLTHQPIFQDSIRAAGLNPYLFEMANIRNQCSWVHSKDRKTATEKAKELVSMSVARASQLQPQQTIEIPVTSSALVVGGGAAGMQASISLAQQGFQVDLVEITDQLGGNLNLIAVPSNGTDPRLTAKKLIGDVASYQEITVHLNSKVVGTTGFKGNFATTIQNSEGSRNEIKHGTTILAVGGEEYRGPEYGYGTNPHIVTQLEFEDIITNQQNRKENLNSLVMIQCVGPAEEYCSRICCSVALKNALAFLDRNPDGQVTILYRDIRVYGFKERLYTEARDRGVVFVRYDDTHKPEVIIEGEKPVINTWDPILRQNLQLQPDLLVLSMPVVPRQDTRKLATQFKAPLDSDGFLLEAHVKLRPVDFATDGVFMAGMAHYPKMLDETLIQAQAAASRAARILSQKTLKAGGQVAVVNPALCTGCLTCVRICSFNVPKIQADLTGIGTILGAAYIESSICQGCGSCVAECPAYAIQLMHYTDQQMIAKVNALFTPPADFIPIEEVMADTPEGGDRDE